MKLKYYLRGLGIGILLTTLVLSMSYGTKKNTELSDEEIIERAKELGMTVKNSGVSIDYDAINESINGSEKENVSDENTEIAQGSESDTEGESEISNEATDTNQEGTSSLNQTVDKNQENANENSEKNEENQSSVNDNDKDGESKDETSKTGQDMDSSESEKEESTNPNSESQKGEETVSSDSKPSATTKPNSNNTEDATENRVTDDGVVKSITILPGLTAKQVCYLLEEHGIISSAGSFNLYMIDQGLTNQIISQKVEIPVNAEFKTIAEILTHTFKKPKADNEN